MNEIPLGLSFDDVLIIPKYSSVQSRSDVSTSVMLEKHELKVPILSANMDTVTQFDMALAMHELGGVGVLHRKYHIFTNMLNEIKGLRKKAVTIAAAVGVESNYPMSGSSYIDFLYEEGVEIFVVDLAHGDSENCAKVVHYIMQRYPKTTIVAGNVVSAEGVKTLANAGAKVIKVGIGPGAACSTRIMTGVGYPQFSAIRACAEAAQNCGVQIIADGGIRNPGDVAKAIAAGADAVMIGSLLAGTDESPGDKVAPYEGGKVYKRYRGMASKEASGRAHAEGVSGMVEYRGSVKDVLDYLMGGLRSAMSYVGASTIPEFQNKAEFIRVTNAGQVESAPHDMKVM